MPVMLGKTQEQAKKAWWPERVKPAGRFAFTVRKQRANRKWGR